jgi:hypothetical protein
MALRDYAVSLYESSTGRISFVFQLEENEDDEVKDDDYVNADEDYDLVSENEEDDGEMVHFSKSTTKVKRLIESLFSQSICEKPSKRRPKELESPLHQSSEPTSLFDDDTVTPKTPHIRSNGSTSSSSKKTLSDITNSCTPKLK